MTLSKPTFGTAYATSESFVVAPPPPAAAYGVSLVPPTSSLAPPQPARTTVAARAAKAGSRVEGRIGCSLS
jgi:hypothetical protein